MAATWVDRLVSFVSTAAKAAPTLLKLLPWITKVGAMNVPPLKLAPPPKAIVSVFNCARLTASVSAVPAARLMSWR
ncbi:MAG: hypothetical protein M3374_03750 [Pseudomonadota bacterium]|nr:hypothetical protein [Pseudomonadota bacterium]